MTCSHTTNAQPYRETWTPAASRLGFVLALGLISLSPARAGDAAAGMPVVVPLSSAFTLQGYGGGSESSLFSEYVLHVSGPERETPVAIADWSAPREEETSFAGDRTAVASNAGVLPPRRPAALTTYSDGTVRVADRAADRAGMMSALMQSQPVSAVRRWAAAVPLPDLQPAQHKVAGAISSIGGRVSGLLPRF